MKAFRRVCVFASVLACLFAVGSRGNAQETWRAGVAKVKITPEKYFWMAGYGARSMPANGKLTELWAKALVLEDAKGQRAALITLDLVGIDHELAQAICAELEKKHRLARPQIAICTSHTHSGPVVGRNLGPLHYLILDAELAAEHHVEGVWFGAARFVAELQAGYFAALARLLLISVGNEL